MDAGSAAARRSPAGPAAASRRGKQGLGIAVLFVILAIQIAATLFFLARLLSDILLIQLPLLPWQVEEWLEVLSSVAMLSGVLGSVMLLRIAGRRMRRIERQLEATSGQFQRSIDRQFDEWALSPTERHVALLVIKGFSNAEIAHLRGTTESTIKSQLTAIFRKSGLGSRQQLATSVIEDLIASIPSAARPEGVAAPH
jgi:DNA-binding CsgD family transcriptional regulator